MPNMIAGQLKTYPMAGLPRDLSDVITQITPEDTPFFTACGAGRKATQTMHEWTEDALNDPGTNARLEGEDVTEFEASVVSELFNITQIFRKAVNVSGTADAIKQAGVRKQYNYQVAQRSKEFKRDMEYALLSNVVEQRTTSAVARRLRGAAAWIRTNWYGGSGGAASTASTTSTTGVAAVAGTKRALTHDMIAEAMEKAYTQGGNPKLLMAAPSVRRKTTTVLKTVNVQDEQAKQARVTDTVRVYESDFGEVRIVPNRVQAFVPYTKDCLLILDMEYWKTSFLRSVSERQLAVTGDSTRGMIIGELTLEARAEAASAMIADINPAL